MSEDLIGQQNGVGASSDRRLFSTYDLYAPNQGVGINKLVLRSSNPTEFRIYTKWSSVCDSKAYFRMDHDGKCWDCRGIEPVEITDQLAIDILHTVAQFKPSGSGSLDKEEV